MVRNVENKIFNESLIKSYDIARDIFNRRVELKAETFERQTLSEEDVVNANAKINGVNLAYSKNEANEITFYGFDKKSEAKQLDISKDEVNKIKNYIIEGKEYRQLKNIAKNIQEGNFGEKEYKTYKQTNSKAPENFKDFKKALNTNFLNDKASQLAKIKAEISTFISVAKSKKIESTAEQKPLTEEEILSKIKATKELHNERTGEDLGDLTKKPLLEYETRQPEYEAEKSNKKTDSISLSDNNSIVDRGSKGLSFEYTYKDPKRDNTFEKGSLMINERTMGSKENLDKVLELYQKVKAEPAEEQKNELNIMLMDAVKGKLGKDGEENKKSSEPYVKQIDLEEYWKLLNGVSKEELGQAIKYLEKEVRQEVPEAQIKDFDKFIDFAKEAYSQFDQKDENKNKNNLFEPTEEELARAKETLEGQKIKTPVDENAVVRKDGKTLKDSGIQENKSMYYAAGGLMAAGLAVETSIALVMGQPPHISQAIGSIVNMYVNYQQNVAIREQQKLQLEFQKENTASQAKLQERQFEMQKEQLKWQKEDAAIRLKSSQARNNREFALQQEIAKMRMMDKTKDKVIEQDVAAENGIIKGKFTSNEVRKKGEKNTLDFKAAEMKTGKEVHGNHTAKEVIKLTSHSGKEVDRKTVSTAAKLDKKWSDKELDKPKELELSGP